MLQGFKPVQGEGCKPGLTVYFACLVALARPSAGCGRHLPVLAGFKGLTLGYKGFKPQNC